MTGSEFWGRVDRSDPEGCWVWPSVSPSGYGWAKWNGRSITAHRVAWVLEHGALLPEGLEVDHLCRNRACVNPAHLEGVSKKENILRGEAPSAQNARKTHCLWGHPFDDANTYLRRWLNPKTGRVKVMRECRNCKRIKIAARRAARREVAVAGGQG